MSAVPTVETVITDPAASDWLKVAVRSALVRDPVDALNDALVLAALLEERLRVQLGLPGMLEPTGRRPG